MHEEGGSCVTTHSLWILFHLPFHIALVLLVEGSNQFIVWRRAIEAIDSAASTLEVAALGFQGLLNTSEIVERIKDPVMGLLKAYEPSNEVETLRQVQEAFADMSDIPDAFWIAYPELSDQNPMKRRWLDDISKIVSAVFNGINNSFEISDTDDQLVTSPTDAFAAVVQKNSQGNVQYDFGFRSVEVDAYVALTMKFRVVVSPDSPAQCRMEQTG